MKKLQLLSLGLVLLFGVVASLDLLHVGFPVTHDGQDHIARIANFYQNLSEGTLIPRWAANLNYGYGHPILEFLYPLPSYMASLFHFLGFSFVDSLKLVYVFGTIASGLSMYLFIRAMWGEAGGIVGGILYMYAPYRFVDLYVRGDVGEHIAFVFLPLVCWGLYKTYKTGKNYFAIVTVISLAFFILAHNAISLMSMPILLSFTLYLWWQSKWKRVFLFQSIFIFVFGFLLSSFFWVPALLEGQYTLRNIVTKGQYVTKFVTIQSLFYGPWSYQSWDISGNNNLTVQLGIIQWIFLTVSVVFIRPFWKKKNQLNVLVIALIIMTLGACFLMLPVSNFIWQKVLLLQNFQFPWRFLAIPVFTLAMLASLITATLSVKKQIIIVIAVMAAAIFLSKDYMHAKSYDVKPESFFTGIYSKTTDTGESSPIWSVRFMEQGYDKPLVDLVDNATIVVQKRTSTFHEYAVSSNENIRLLENTLYFPGWRVLVDGKAADIQFQEPKYRGLITFNMPSGTHTIKVLYQESKLRVLGDMLSVIGFVGLVGLWIYFSKRKLL